MIHFALALAAASPALGSAYMGPGEDALVFFKTLYHACEARKVRCMALQMEAPIAPFSNDLPKNELPVPTPEQAREISQEVSEALPRGSALELFIAKWVPSSRDWRGVPEGDDGTRKFENHLKEAVTAAHLLSDRIEASSGPLTPALALEAFQIYLEIGAIEEELPTYVRVIAGVPTYKTAHQEATMALYQLDLAYHEFCLRLAAES